MPLALAFLSPPARNQPFSDSCSIVQADTDGWVLPQVLEGNQILFSEEEVNSTVNLFLGLPEGCASA